MSDARPARPRVVVLMGGPDAEHEVSLLSGAEVAR
ncbi:MAG: D-ala D-ala ligase N-terminus, partial [Planctomycetota bacterium]